VVPSDRTTEPLTQVVPDSKQHIERSPATTGMLYPIQETSVWDATSFCTDWLSEGPAGLVVMRPPSIRGCCAARTATVAAVQDTVMEESRVKLAMASFLLSEQLDHEIGRDF
jgi:hypothetical protein